MRKTTTPYLVFIFLSTFSFAQSKISGVVKDKNTQEGILGANIVAIGTSKGASTNLEGQFEFSLEAGTYYIKTSFIGYNTKIDTIVVDGTSSFTLEILLKEESTAIDEVVVEAKADLSSENLLALERKESSLLVQNIGAQEMNKVAASDASEGLNKVVGLSTFGAKYVVVRGLSDRYNNGMLNGLPIASPNPDKRVIPFDIFSTNVIQNIDITKSFSPELYADFSGASINVITKSYPTNPILSLKIGTSINSQTTFKPFYLDPEKSHDMLGYNKTRFIPENIANDPNFNSTNYQENFTEENFFNTKHNPTQTKAPMHKSLRLTYGNYYKLRGDARIGLILNTNFSDQYENQSGKLALAQAQGVLRTNFNEQKYIYSTTKSALGNVFVKIAEGQEISINTLYSHLTENSVNEYNGFYIDRDPDNVYTRRITYQDYSLLANQLLGEHKITNRLKIQWAGSYSIAKATEPDRRQWTFLYDPQIEETDVYSINSLDAFSNHRFFSFLTDQDATGKFEINYDVKQSSNNKRTPLNALKLGIQYRNKTRDFYIKRYQTTLSESFLINKNQVNIYDIDNKINISTLNQGDYTVEEITQPSDKYNANFVVIAPFLQYKHTFIPQKFEIIIGLRTESSKQTIKYKNQTDSEFSPQRIENLPSFDLFPSLIMKYNISDKNIIRLSGSKTIARPDFKEIAPFQYRTAFAYYVVQGNTNLKNGYNYNTDLRFERFNSAGNMLALGVFAKYLQDPIVQNVQAGAVLIQSYQNAKNAYLGGVEFELRQDLGIISKSISGLSLNTNISLLYSNIVIGETEGQVSTNQTSNRRPLVGASPYLINVDLTYSKFKNNLEYQFTLAYNIFGKRLTNIGALGIGDIYEFPVNTLHFTANVKLGAQRKWGLGMEAKNLLNPTILRQQEILDQNTYEVIKTIDINTYKKGTVFSLSLTYNIL